jgi:DNA-binding transcriptional ArsR family regulator
MSNFEDVFRAIAHRTRREILTLLHSRQTELSSGEISGRFPLTWATLCSHLEILVRARLVKKRKAGREVFYALNPQRLKGVVRTWVDSFD